MRNYPRVPGKHDLPGIISPAEHADYVRVTCNAGRAVALSRAVMFYQGSALNRVLARRPAARMEGWISGDLWLTTTAAGPVALCGHFGKGAPAAGLILEQLGSLGVRQVVTVGTAGGLAPHLRIGATVVCDRAIRDEGLSYHYLPPAEHCAASEVLTAHLSDQLRALEQDVYLGTSWSIDAPYRETADEVRTHRQQHVLTVDMEAAGVFAVGLFRGIQVGAAFVVTDLVREDGQRRHARDPRCADAIDRLVTAAIQTVALPAETKEIQA